MENNFFLEVVDKVECRIIEGATYDIQAFFDSCVDDSANIITSYKFDQEYTLKNNQYKILIEVKEMNKAEIDMVFLRFLRFISYANFTAHSRSTDETNSMVKYFFVTSNKNNKGFYCELVFQFL